MGKEKAVVVSSAGKAGIEWVTIPGGSFMMGAKDCSRAQPVHRVKVKTFEIAKTEVTVQQYKACVDAGACTAPGMGAFCNSGKAGRENHPVNCVTWDQAKVFAQWVGGRLPTEAEWEYAARSAGKNWKYPWGNEDASCERANIPAFPLGCVGGTAPVCSKPAGNTEQGLCDMAGNVWEWVQDVFHETYKGAPADGSAWESPTGPFRANRGGSCCDDVTGFERAEARGAARQDDSGLSDSGLRPARSLSR